MSAHADTALARVESIVSAGQLLSNSESLLAFAVDGVRARAVVRPESAEQVSEIVRAAAREKLAVIPVAGRSKLGVGMPPARFDLAMDLTRMNRVLAYDPGDLTLGVQPGIRITELNRVLAEHGQFLPLLTPFLDDATIGGILAANSLSPLMQLYGTGRDFVLGTEFVTGEGSLVKSGGRVVKNVTGYDLHKLLIGSLGTLGIITRVNFKTFPVPRTSTTFISSFPEPAEALVLLRAIRESPLRPLLVEAVSPQAARILAPQRRRLRAEEWSVVVAAGGQERVVERFAAEISRMAQEAHATSYVALNDEEDPEVLGKIREFPKLMREHTSAATIVKVSVLPGHFARILEEARRIGEKNQLATAFLVRAAGTVYAAFAPPANDEATLARLASACGELEKTARETGGSAVVELCPLELKQKINIWGPPRADFALMQRVKKTFDPQGILAPGRFVGGL